MSENIKYDALSELFRQKLENHQIEVDKDDWYIIKSRLYNSKNSNIRWLWSAVAAAAAITAFVVLFNPFTKTESETIVSQNITHKNIEINSEPLIESDRDNHTTKTENNLSIETEKQTVKDNHTTKTENNLSIETEKQIVKNNQTNEKYLTSHLIEIERDVYTYEDSGQVKEIETAPLYNDLNDKLLSDSYSQILNNSDKKADTIDLEREILKFYLSLSDKEVAPHTQKSEKWLLAAGFGVGGYSDVLNYNLKENSESLYFDGRNEYATTMSEKIVSFDEMDKNDFTKINHLPPLSFRITAQKTINNRCGIESGLLYTYLSSRFEWDNYNVHQSLHYLGIPVNIKLILWNLNHNWNIYSSAGIVIEKGLRAIYRQEIISEERFTKAESSIKGLQWAVNGALGINYKLVKGWGLFFEPRIGYSFKNEQPISIRTEYPFHFGISIGLNYEL